MTIIPGPADFARWLIQLLKDDFFNLWRDNAAPPPDRPPPVPLPSSDAQFANVQQVVAAACYWHPGPANAAVINALAAHVQSTPWNSGGMLP